MSQKLTTRKGALNDEKEKGQSPAKDVMKKIPPIAEKEKQNAEKTDKSDKHSDKSEKSDKHSDKSEKSDKHSDKSAKSDKQTNKPEKQTDRKQADKSEKPTEKPEKQADKKQGEKSEKQDEKTTEKNVDKKEKTVEKKETKVEKSKEDGAKEEKNAARTEAQDSKEKPQPNGTPNIHNGAADVTNGTANETNGTVKATRTPETPRPASDKQTNDKESGADPKDAKLLKHKEDAPPPASDRKLRSSDSPRHQEGKKSLEVIKKQDKPLETVSESSEKTQDNVETVEKERDSSKQARQPTDLDPVVRMVDIEKEMKKNAKQVEGKSQLESVEMEVIVEVEADDEKEEPRKVDTNYSKSRVKVSPYRRNSRLADQTTTSIMANYTGNNTTMEMDITENSSMVSEREGTPSPDEDGSYLRGLRSIRARNSYKKLGQMTLSNFTGNRSARPVINAAGTESRPTAPVVGRKRRPDGDRDTHRYHQADLPPAATACKRMRLLERIAHPFRRTLPHTMQANSPDIVGINTDLPLTAPVVSADTFDPESLKLQAPSAVATLSAPAEPLAVPLAPHHQHDSKRCAIM